MPSYKEKELKNVRLFLDGKEIGQATSAKISYESYPPKIKASNKTEED